MRKMYRFVLILVFVSLVILSAAVFVADFYFTSAKRLDKEYKWVEAEELYQKSLKINPFCAEHFAGYADFILKQSELRKGENKVLWLERAKVLYEKAQNLNPGYAKYTYSLGKIALRLDEKTKAIEYFKSAIEKHPYSLLNSYQIGYDLLEIWDLLDEAAKEFVLTRFKYVLSQRMYYHGLIYPFLYEKTKDFKILQKVTPDNFKSQNALYNFMANNELWQYRSSQKKLIDSYLAKESVSEFQELLRKKKGEIEAIKEKYKDKLNSAINKEDWEGVTHSGGNAYQEGKMYWTGTMNAAVYILPGKRTLEITARGTAADNIWPYMIIELDGEVIGEAFVWSAEWRQYSFQVSSGGGLKVISITFANDGGSEDTGEDRNLYVGEVNIE